MELTEVEFGYGFYLERALKSILVKGVGEQVHDKFPVIVVVTDEFKKAVFDTPFDSFKSLFPETDLFFELNDEGMLLHHSLIDSPLEEIGLGKIDFSSSEILKGETNGIGVNKNSGSELILLNKNEAEIDFESLTKWEQGMYLHGEYLKSKLFPGDGENSWDKILSLSIKAGIMTPLTSYIVVENKAQEAMIKKKQDQVINGNKGLDLQEEVQEMTEPEEWLIVAFLLFLCVYYREKIVRKLKFN